MIHHSYCMYACHTILESKSILADISSVNKPFSRHTDVVNLNINMPGYAVLPSRRKMIPALFIRYLAIWYLYDIYIFWSYLWYQCTPQTMPAHIRHTKTVDSTLDAIWRILLNSVMYWLEQQHNAPDN